MKLLEGGGLFPRISVWAAAAVEQSNFVGASEVSRRWFTNRPYVATLARSLDPSDALVPRAQSLLDDMASFEGQLPTILEMALPGASEPEAQRGKTAWLARIGRAAKRADGASANESAATATPAVQSPLRPENVKSGWDVVVAAAVGGGLVGWAEEHRDSVNPIEEVPADVINKFVNSPEYASGFAVGGLEGAWAALKDNAHVFVDIYDLLVDLVKAKLANGDLGVLFAVRDKIMGLIAAGRQVPAALKAFAERWNDSSDLAAQGHFQGHAVGYIAVQVLALVIGAIAPGGQYADVIRILKLATDPLGGLLELGTAAKATRAAKAAGNVEHAAEGAVAGERAGVRAAEDVAADGERTLGGMFEAAGTTGSDARGIAVRPEPSGPATTARTVSLDGRIVDSSFAEMSDKARHVVRQLEGKGWVRVSEIRPDELAEVSRWFGVEVAVVQAPYGKLRVVLGHRTGILTDDIRAGEVFIMHTHPVMTTRADHFNVDLSAAGKHVEAVVDWNGQVTYFSKSGIKNPVRPDGTVEPLLDYQAAFMNKDGSIVGFARIDVIDGPGGATVKVRE